ncbi:hypothetical protein T4A_8620 [Trichinella pseudospiralis]|uniref:Uncharacterized protein n=1 Tax=Trichinella pseudospiralis TaxID=6337 RepID=A0A0V1EIV8_TRIPS|nr:hypothetical protein T4A_8620 [Trichinella pseudospiralis]
MGLNRMEASPQPPMLMPQLRIRVKILSRVVTSRHVIAQNVPRPRALCTNAGYFSSNACKPAKSVRPAICVFLSKLSRRMMRNVTSNSASFDGSPSQKPPRYIFLENVTKSGDSGNSQCSWAHILPVPPHPVCTSSTMNAAPACLVSFCKSVKNSLDAKLSPPSACIGSTKTAATSLPL